MVGNITGCPYANVFGTWLPWLRWCVDKQRLPRLKYANLLSRQQWLPWRPTYINSVTNVNGLKLRLLTELRNISHEAPGRKTEVCGGMVGKIFQITFTGQR